MRQIDHTNSFGSNTNGLIFGNLIEPYYFLFGFLNISGIFLRNVLKDFDIISSVHAACLVMLLFVMIWDESFVHHQTLSQLDEKNKYFQGEKKSLKHVCDR